jgi:hypothetical protein
MKLLAKISLAFSLEAHTLDPPAEFSFGSAIEAFETIRRVEVDGALEDIESFWDLDVVTLVSIDVSR